jgi:hypothetical protein
LSGKAGQANTGGLADVRLTFVRPNQKHRQLGTVHTQELDSLHHSPSLTVQRELLVKTVLYALPTFFLSVFKLSKWGNSDAASSGRVMMLIGS